MDSMEYIKGYIERAREAQAIFEGYDQGTVDLAVMSAGRVIYDNSEILAKMAVEETGMGKYEDKVLKNKSKASIIWNSLKGKKSRGIIHRNPVTGIVKIAKPIGIAGAITPSTNPIVTPMSNAMFALKGGNAIIITPHHSAVKCSGETVRLIRNQLEELGLPVDLVQILDRQSRENTGNLISSVDVVIATGGMGMVHAAYSSGRPALGVGAGNVQCIIDRGVDYEDAVEKIIVGRGFDNGIICSAEQSVICPEEELNKIMGIFEIMGAYVVRGEDERIRLRETMFVDGSINRHTVGKNPWQIGRLAGIPIPEDARIIVVGAQGTGNEDPLAKEKMCPVIAAFSYGSFPEAVEIARVNLEAEGKGHSVSIHSNNEANIEYAGEKLCVSRFLVNQVCASSAGGSFFNGLNPTNTLGCGSWGRNSISENLTYYHLINISRIAYHRPGNHVPDDEELWSLSKGLDEGDSKVICQREG